MRLGAADWNFLAETVDDLGPLCEKLDTYGLSAVIAPSLIGKDALGAPDGDAALAAYGETARERGIVIGESFYFANLLDPDQAVRAEHIANVRTMLVKAETMGCKSVITLVGTTEESGNPTAPHPTDGYLYSDACKADFREVVLRIVDGLDLPTVKYIIEPWNNTFFYQPEEIAEFFDSVDHPMVGLHLDQMNMIHQSTYYDTTSLINKTFDLLADKVFSVHMKDLRIGRGPGDFVSFKEVLIGDGSMDYETYLRRLADLPEDTPCFCEHLSTEAEYALNFARVQSIARKVCVAFLPRGQ